MCVPEESVRKSTDVGVTGNRGRVGVGLTTTGRSRQRRETRLFLRVGSVSGFLDTMEGVEVAREKFHLLRILWSLSLLF